MEVANRKEIHYEDMACVLLMSEFESMPSAVFDIPMLHPIQFRVDRFAESDIVCHKQRGETYYHAWFGICKPEDMEKVKNKLHKILDFNADIHIFLERGSMFMYQDEHEDINLHTLCGSAIGCLDNGVFIQWKQVKNKFLPHHVYTKNEVNIEIFRLGKDNKESVGIFPHNGDANKTIRGLKKDFKILKKQKKY